MKDTFVKLSIILLSALVSIFTSILIYRTVKLNYITDSGDNSVFMICDVYDVVYNGNSVEIDIVLPNKELLTRIMRVDDDLPEEFSEVVIETSDLDDYSTYNVVGMR